MKNVGFCRTKNKFKTSVYKFEKSNIFGRGWKSSNDRWHRVSLRKSKVGAIRANLIVISGSGGNGEREAHRDTESAVYVTWAEGRELPREIRGGHDKTGEDGIGKSLQTGRNRFYEE